MSTTVERFMSKVRLGDVPSHRPDLGPCHLWIAGASEGYGHFWADGKMHRAHVWIYRKLKGPLGRFVLDHLCRVTMCVNLKHLELVTSTENIRRGETGKWQLAITHCPRRHEYTTSNTRVRTRRGIRMRECRACDALRSAARRRAA